MLEGHSGSQLNKHGNMVIKESSYLANCSDREVREKFLVELPVHFQHAPKILEIEGNTIKYEFVPGVASFEKADLRELGKILRELHSLKLAAPKKETGVDWLKQMAEINLIKYGLNLNVASLVAQSRDDQEVIIHGEPADLVVGEDGEITILDWDEAGLGHRYQDIGYILFKCHELRGGETDFKLFLAGYNDNQLDVNKIRAATALITLTYAHWANTDFRIQLGMQLVSRF